MRKSGVSQGGNKTAMQGIADDAEVIVYQDEYGNQPQQESTETLRIKA